MKNTVIIDKLALNNESLINQLTKAISDLLIVDEFNKAKAIFIKPNLTFNRFKEGVTTRKEFVEALVVALRRINSSTMIYIGEGEGGSKCFSMTEAMTTMGFYKLEKDYPNVKIINLSQLPTQVCQLKAKGKPYSIELPKIFFDEIDFSITCPLPKVHCMTKITLSYKNQWGCVPDVMRLRNHYVIDELLCQICDKLKFRYAFLDGMYGLDNNGPMNGKPVRLDWFAASNSLGAFDAIVSELMEIKWQKVGHIVQAKKRGYVPERKDINILGDLNQLKRKFTLKRNLWNYPALIAFNSKRLTTIVYLSRFSKIIHDIMYTFRKRPLDN